MVNSKLVVEKKKEVLLDWRGNEKEEEECAFFFGTGYDYLD